MVFERLAQAIERDERAVLFTVIEGEPLGSAHARARGRRACRGRIWAELEGQAGELIRGHTNRIVEHGDARVFAEIYAPPPRLLVYGAVDTAESLASCAPARLAGDRRRRAREVRDRERIPSATEIIVAWPEETMSRSPPTTRPRSSSSRTTTSSTCPR